MSGDFCICCGRLGYALARCGGGVIHFDCWAEHHSSPEPTWPPDHACGLTTADPAPPASPLAR